MTTHISPRSSQLLTTRLSHQHLSLILQLLAAIAAFWPIWYWYCERISDRSDEPLGIVALITVIVLSALNVSSRGLDVSTTLKRSAGCQSAPDFVQHVLRRVTAALPLLLVLLYCIAIPCAPLVVQSIIAVTLIATLLIRSCATRFSLPAGNCVLLLLSLPIVASLNFYFGYPLRLIASHLASVLLHLAGLAVHVQGAAIFWNGTDVSIDQPCSGIRMLWVALYLSATLSSMLRLKSLSTVQILSMSVVLAVVANCLRVSSLFYLESGIIKIDAPWHSIVHSGIGVVAFATSAVILTWFAFFLSDSSLSPASPTLPQPFATATNSPNRWQLITFIICCTTAAILPFFVSKTQDSVDLHSFKGWPTQFEGRPIHTQQLSLATAKFADRFPGCIAVFASDNRRIIFRWVAQPTRQLHSAEICYRASGYEINWLPQYQDAENHRWTAFEAIKDSEKLRVRERIFDDAGNSWTDVSAWYWSAVLQRSRAPWWSVCVIERTDCDNHSIQQSDGTL